MDTIGVRELRQQLAAVLRRAEQGERLTVTVDGRPVARIVPLEPDGEPTLDDLVAAGLVIAPRRPGPGAVEAEDPAIDVRLDDALDELPWSMTLAIDTSALVRRYLHVAGHDLVVATMEADDVWCASALARTETLQVLHHMAVSRSQHDRLWTSLRADWDSVYVVPVDERCLADAVEIGASFRVRSTDAIHLAAAGRLPHPVRYLTFDRRQIPAADALGFEVVAPFDR